MKRILATAMAAAMMLTVFAGCGNKGGEDLKPARVRIDPREASASSDVTASDSGEISGDVINVWSFTNEVPEMISNYIAQNPDFPYKVKTTIVTTSDGSYQPALDQALSAGGAQAPDIYCAESAFVLKYTQGEAASYASSYKDLGIEVDRLLEEAAIVPYAVEVGTNRGGELVGLPYQATGGAFIYRRSIAMDVWGSDDPAVIKDKVGPGWDKFMSAAAELKEKGYGIISGDGDLWHPIENSSDRGWIVDGRLYIDPKREQFIDLAKEINDRGYSNNTVDWQDPWYADMRGAGPQQIFGFFGPAWLINFVMAGNSGGSAPGEGTYGDWAVCEPTTGFSWGGTWVIANKDTKYKEAVAEILTWITLDSSDTGLQYHWANGTLNGPGGTKDTVASGTVMEKSDGALAFLGGQDMFDVFVPAGESAKGTNLTPYDETISTYWRDEVRAYVAGNKSRSQAISDFKQNVANNLNIPIE